jgi:FixJ family two-component response regulator
MRGYVQTQALLNSLPFFSTVAHSHGKPALSRDFAVDGADGVVYVLDDDDVTLKSIESLLCSVNLKTKAFSSAADFFEFDAPGVPSCLLLEVRRRGPGGLAIQASMLARNIFMPVIFITAHGDISLSVKAMKAGAFDFLTKPFQDQTLLDAVQEALLADKERLRTEGSLATLRNQYEQLTPRERQVLAMIVNGQLNKQIAAALSLSEVTVKIHRREVMRKTGSRTVADLVKKAVLCDIKNSLLNRIPGQGT